MFNLFNAKPKVNTNVLLWLAIAAFFIIIGVALLTQASIVQASSHGLSSIFEGEIVACDELADCNLCTLIETAQRVVLFLVGFSVVVAILMFVFAGFLLVTAGANDGQLSRGKGIFWSVFIGLFIVLAAWLIINLILSTFLAPEYGTWYNFDCEAGTSAAGAALNLGVGGPKGEQVTVVNNTSPDDIFTVNDPAIPEQGLPVGPFHGEKITIDQNQTGITTGSVRVILEDGTSIPMACGDIVPRPDISLCDF